MATSSLSVLEGDAPRDPAAAAPIVRRAYRLHRVALAFGIGFIAVLSVVVVSVAGRDALRIAPPILLPVFFLGTPAVLHARRSRKQLQHLVVHGRRHRARVTKSQILSVGFGSRANRISVEYSVDGTARTAELAVAASERRAEAGEELDLLYAPEVPLVVLAWSERLGVELGRTQTKAESSTPRRVLRLAIGVAIGAILFAGLLFLISSNA